MTRDTSKERNSCSFEWVPATRLAIVILTFAGSTRAWETLIEDILRFNSVRKLNEGEVEVASSNLCGQQGCNVLCALNFFTVTNAFLHYFFGKKKKEKWKKREKIDFTDKIEIVASVGPQHLVLFFSIFQFSLNTFWFPPMIKMNDIWDINPGIWFRIFYPLCKWFHKHFFFSKAALFISGNNFWWQAWLAIKFILSHKENFVAVDS